MLYHTKKCEKLLLKITPRTQHCCQLCVYRPFGVVPVVHLYQEKASRGDGHIIASYNSFNMTLF